MLTFVQRTIVVCKLYIIQKETYFECWRWQHGVRPNLSSKH